MEHPSSIVDNEGMCINTFNAVIFIFIITFFYPSGEIHLGSRHQGAPSMFLIFVGEHANSTEKGYVQPWIFLLRVDPDLQRLNETID